MIGWDIQAMIAAMEEEGVIMLNEISHR